GETIDFHVAADVPYSVTYCRHFIEITGNNEEDFHYDDVTADIDGDPYENAIAGILPASDEPWRGCNWPITFSLKVPDWRSGIYSAHCVTPGSPTEWDECYIVFIVMPRLDDNPTADYPRLALIASTNTWNAYNAWATFDMAP